MPLSVTDALIASFENPQKRDATLAKLSEYQYDFHANPAKYDIKALLQKAAEDLSNGLLNALLSNNTFKEYLVGEIAARKNSAAKYSSSIFEDSSISTVERRTTIAIESRKQEEQKLNRLTSEKETIIGWWFRQYATSRGRKLKAKIKATETSIENKKQTKNENLKKLENWEKKLKDMDLIQQVDWKPLLLIVKALRPGDENLIREIEDFISSLTKPTHPNFIINKYFQQYLMSELFSEIKDLQKFYIDYPDDADINAIYNLVLNMTESVADFSHFAVIQANIQQFIANGSLASHVRKSIQTFIAVMGQLESLGKSEQFSFSPKVNEVEGKLVLNLSQPMHVFPASLHEQLVNNSQYCKIEGNKAIITFPLTPMHREIVKFSFISCALSLYCIKSIHEARIAIQNAESANPAPSDHSVIIDMPFVGRRGRAGRSEHDMADFESIHHIPTERTARTQTSPTPQPHNAQAAPQQNRTCILL